jgi:two-component system NarL family sensor kinase
VISRVRNRRCRGDRIGGARGLVIRFALAGLLVLAGVGVLEAFVLQRTGVTEATRDARVLTRMIARSVIEPALRNGLPEGRPAAFARLDHVVRTAVLPGPVTRVKLWTPGGRIVYSDEHRLVGQRFPLGADDRDVLEHNGVEAQLSDLSAPENRFERGQGKLLEVYLPVWTRNGKPLLFESYQRFSSVSQGGHRILAEFAPPLAIALVLLWLLQLPVAARLARRLRRTQDEREELLVRAIDASDQERRRIAAELHDGVVQDLAGITFGLGAAASEADRASTPRLAGTVRGAAEGTRDCMRRLRSLLVDIHPPTLHAAGLTPTVEDLAAPLRRAGVEVTCDVRDGVASPAVEDLMFRTVREALRNVDKHAEAKRVRVTVEPEGERLVLTVRDDGRGLSPAEVAQRRREGHMGLRLLADRARDLEGRLDVTGEPRAGTIVRLEVPAG